MGADLYIRSLHDTDEQDGYFRDSYNGWDVLWQFGLSWWNDVLPLLDSQSSLSVEKILALLALLDERQSQFDDNMTERAEDDRSYFQQKARELRGFLQQAIELNEPIDCSL
jgi:hypothetical protein